MDDLMLAQLLCSRLCHDLVGPVGAIGNGVEMLQEEDDAEMRVQALSLVGHSAEQASRRLRFYRLAFGAAQASADLALAEAETLAREFLEGGRVTLLWQASPDARLPRDDGKLLLNLVLTGAEALPRGGTLRVAADGAGMSIEADGAGARLAEEATRALCQDGGETELSAKVAPARLARRLAQTLGGEIVAEVGDNRLRLRFRMAG